MLSVDKIEFNGQEDLVYNLSEIGLENTFLILESNDEGEEFWIEDEYSYFPFAEWPTNEEVELAGEGVFNDKPAILKLNAEQSSIIREIFVERAGIKTETGSE